MRKLLIATFCVALCSLAGCNTVKGLGQDIQKAGEKIEDATRKK